MPLSTDIRLPRDQDVVFPDSCCGCLRARPGELYVVKGRRSSLIELLFPWIWLTRRVVQREVPICVECLRGATSRRWRSRWFVIASIAIGILVLVFFVPMRDFSRGQRRLLQIGVAILAFVPWVVWTALRPPLFDLTVGKTHVDHEFANARYAEIFRVANSARSVASR